MIRCLLVATDGSHEAMAAVRKGVELAQSLGAGASLHAVSAVAYAEIPSVLAKQPANAPDLLSDNAQEALQLAAAEAYALGVEMETHLVNGDIVPAILKCADEIGADMLIAGYHGQNRLVRMVMGSVVGKLVRSTTLPVLVVRATD
jgi:nucleotide-binding universal stress UspA family protein